MSGGSIASDRGAPRIRKLYVFGAGGHGREIAWLAQRTWGAEIALEFVVDRAEFLNEPINGIPVSLLDETQGKAPAHFVVAVGDPGLRRRAAAACTAIGYVSTGLIHPNVEMSNHVVLGEGVVIFPGAIITTNVRIDAHTHINLGCTISHDVTIGEFSTLSPGVHVSGHVEIGRNVFIGTGATVINGRQGAPLVISDNAIIAAGACVTKAVDPGAVVAGVPAARKR